MHQPFNIRIISTPNNSVDKLVKLLNAGYWILIALKIKVNKRLNVFMAVYLSFHWSFLGYGICILNPVMNYAGGILRYILYILYSILMMSFKIKVFSLDNRSPDDQRAFFALISSATTPSATSGAQGSTGRTKNQINNNS